VSHSPGPPIRPPAPFARPLRPASRTRPPDPLARPADQAGCPSRPAPLADPLIRAVTQLIHGCCLPAWNTWWP